MHVLKTKLGRPALSHQAVIERPLLLEYLQRHSRQAMLFIHAAAGYGKTTLMRQLAQQLSGQGAQVGWLTLDADDNDPIRLYQYLWLALLGSECAETFTDGVVAKHHIYVLAQRLQQPIALFIDELEQLENQDSLNLIWWLYQHMPAHCHLVIASRTRPAWSFAKEMLQGRAHIATEEQLSLKAAEAGQLVQFLQQQNPQGAEVDAALAALLIDKTEGWITGIQLTNLYLQDNQDIHAFIQHLSGAHNQIVDYLNEQVFLQQSAEMQQVLLQMSILRKISAALLAELSGNPAAQEILAAMNRKGLFIQALDDQRVWYRIHPLFREFLLSRFRQQQPELFLQMHMQAAEWHSKRHSLMEAIYHAQQAENQQLMASLLNQLSRELVLEGRIYTLLELARQLPESVLAQHPHLLYDLVWSLLLTHQSALASHYLQLWHSIDQQQTLLQHEDQLGLAPLVALLEDNLGLAYQLAQQNLEKLSKTAYFSRAPLIGIGALYQICTGNIAEARKLMLQTRIVYVQGHNLYGLMVVDCIDAVCDYLLGDLQLAESKFCQIGCSQEYQQLGLDESNRNAITAILSSFKADLYYEMNQLERAEAALENFNGGDQLVMPDMVVVGYILQLRLAELRHDPAAAQRCLHQAQMRSHQWALPRLAQTLQLYLGHAGAAGSAMAEAGPLTGKAALPELLNFTHLLRGDDLMAQRRQIFSGEAQQACGDLLAKLQAFAVYPLRRARIQLLLCLAYEQLGQPAAAFAYLEQALGIVMPAQAVRIILDEHPKIWEVLAQFAKALAGSRQGNAQLLAYLQQLFALQQQALPAEKLEAAAPHELLSKREIQLLEKLNEGLTDAEIAEQVFLSVNTVKWHLRNIYNKLTVRSRLEAVTAAKKIGLIA